MCQNGVQPTLKQTLKDPLTEIGELLERYSKYKGELELSEAWITNKKGRGSTWTWRGMDSKMLRRTMRRD